MIAYLIGKCKIMVDLHDFGLPTTYMLQMVWREENCKQDVENAPSVWYGKSTMAKKTVTHSKAEGEAAYETGALDAANPSFPRG